MGRKESPYLTPNYDVKGGIAMRVDHIDYRLVVQHAVKSRLTEMAAGKFTPLEVDKALQQLISLGSHVELGALRLLEETTNEREASLAASMLIKLEDESLINQALQLLHKPRVADVAKGQALRFLTAMGCEVGEIMTPAIFKDMNKLASDSMEQLLQDLAETGDILGYILEEFAGFSPEMQYSYVQDLVRTRDGRVVPLLDMLARGDDEVIAAEAVRGLGTIPTGESLRALLALWEAAPDGFLKNITEREARRLTFKGLQPVPTTSFTLGEPFHVLVTGIDGKGCRIVWVSRFLKGNRGRQMAVSFLLSTEEGLKDCYGSVQLSRRESKSMLRTLRQKYPAVDGDMAYAEELVRDALYVSRQAGRNLPPQWVFWQQVFAPAAMSPRPFALDSTVSEIEANAEPLVPELLAIEELAEWYEEDPLVYDAAEEILKIGKRFRSVKVKKKAAEDVIHKVALALFQPRLGEIIRRLDLTGEFLSRRGKPACARTLLRVSRALRSGEPPEENTFLRSLLALSVRVAEHNLRAGFDLRKNPEIFE